MGLKCRIAYSNEGIKVVDELGNPSRLYEEISNSIEDEQLALEVWATAYTEDFGNKGEDATVEELTKYFDQTLASEMKLDEKEQYQVEDFMRRNGMYSLSELNSKLQEIFKPNGLYGFDVDAALASGIFSEAEITDFDIKSIIPLLRKIEGHLQSNEIFVEPDDNVYHYRNTDNKTILGTFEKVSQKEIDNDIIKAVGGFTDIESFYDAIKDLPYDTFLFDFANNDQFAKDIVKRFKGMKKIPKLSIGPDGNLTDQENTYFTTLRNTVGIKQDPVSIEAEIEYLDSIPQDIWDENSETIARVLKEVEKEFVKYNIDVIGIADISSDRGGVMFLIEKAKDVISNPTDANLAELSAAHSRIIPQKIISNTRVIEDKYAGYNIVTMYSNLSQSDLFMNFGLIRVGENLYHKVGQNENVNVVKDYIYEEYLDGNIQIPSKYILTKDKKNKVGVLEDISRYLSSRKIPNIDTRFSELYSAYQVAFDHSPVKENTEDVRNLIGIKTDTEYLKSGFVSDFYNEILKEKADNTELYRNKLSKFEVNDKDIVLVDKIDSLSGIPMVEELKDYIKLKKDTEMDYLLDPSDDILSEDMLAINKPESIKEYNGNIIVDGDYIVTTPTIGNYIKINNEIYRKVLSENNSDLFLKISTPVNEVYFNSNLNFTFDKTEAQKVMDRYGMLSPSTIDYTQYNNIIAKSKVNSIKSTNLRKLSTLKDNSYDFFEVNDSIVAYKDGVRVGSIRVDRYKNGFADAKISVSEIHRGKGIGTELYLRLFDKMDRTGKTFYPAPIRTKQAENIFSRVKGILIETADGGYTMQRSDVRFQVDAWHGSPHSFNRFTTEKMGTGEGTQAFGWGLYFTDLESIAREYADKLSDFSIKADGVEISKTNPLQDVWVYIVNSKNKTQAIANLKQAQNDNRVDYNPSQKAIEYLNTIKDLSITKDNRNLYKVSLHKGKTPSEYKWLEWDKPVDRETKEAIVKGLNEIGISTDVGESEVSGWRNGVEFKELVPGYNKIERAETGEAIYNIIALSFSGSLNEIQKEASLFLLENGIDGVKYPAESISRGATSDTARGFNYVVFDKNAVTIEDAVRFQDTNNNEFLPTPTQILDAVVEKLSQTGLSNNIFTDRQRGISRLNQLKKLGVVKQQVSTEQVNGFTDGNDIYILNDGVNVSIHEHGHLWYSWAKTNRPDLISRGIELIQDTPYYTQVQESAIYSQMTEEQMLEEAIVQAIGDKGEQIVDNARKTQFEQWLSELWDSIKNMLGMSNVTTEQLQDMSMDEFANAVAVDLLRGIQFSELVGEERVSEISGVRQADQLPLTLSIFNRPEFIDLQGKQVNPVTIQQLLNKTGIKQVERDIVNQIIEDNFKGQKRIDFNEFETIVRANIMPLERIYTSSFADYGMDNLGDGRYGTADTIIFNAPVEHGVTGHFSGDFKADNRQSIEYKAKQLNDNVWVAVEEGYENQANNNNIYQYVGTAGTKEAVETWIENYNNPYNKNNTSVVKRGGSYGLIKEDGEDLTYVNESDLPDNFNNIDSIHEILLTKMSLAKGSPINKGMFGHIRTWQDGQDFYVAELQSDYFQKNKAKDTFIFDTKEYVEAIAKINEDVGLEFARREQAGELTDRKVVSKLYVAEIVKRQGALEQKFFEKLTPQERQFMASQKAWEQRIVRETIKEAAKSGVTSLRFPTPYTLSVIEGYVSSEGGKTPYYIPDYDYVEGADALRQVKVTDENLKIGDIIYLDSGNEYYVVKSNDNAITVVNKEAIDKRIITREKIAKKLEGELEIGEDLEKVVDKYIKLNNIVISKVAIDVINSLKDGELSSLEETFGQPSTYSEGQSKESFDIAISLDNIQQTVVRKYEDIARIIQRERGEDNFKIVTDKNGFEWYETEMTTEDKNQPVVAFQITENKIKSVQLTADDIYNLSDSQRLNPGGVRFTQKVDKGIIKVADDNAGRLQNLLEGQISITPEIVEVGKDYVIVEEVSTTGPKLDRFRNMLQQTLPSDWMNKTESLRKSLTGYGVEQILDDNYSLAYGDIIAADNWGMKGDQIMLIDAGSLYAGSLLSNQTPTINNRLEELLENSRKKTASIFDSKIELLNLYTEREGAEIIEKIDSCGR